MVVLGDVESVNLRTGERFRRAVGNGESRLQSEPRLGPREPTDEEIQEGNEQLESIIAAAKRKISMHYRNGRPAQNGDRVVSFGNSGGCKLEAVGVLINAVAGNDYCNGQIVVNHGWNNGTALVVGACLCDCLHADDLEAMLKEKGLDKRPQGK
jgi:hypothetical protein